MKKIILFFILAGFMLLSCPHGYGEEYNQFDIKYGMHERAVAKKYGEPLLVKKIRVNPISKKKMLYELDEANYMILYFFSGRLHKVVLLEDVGFDEARVLFDKN